MTFPAASFSAVAPPPDGLTLAFTHARRRRNSKAAVSAFGGAVAIASVLSMVTPPGQSLVQEPPQPAQGGLLTGLPDAPRHGAPAVRTPSITQPAFAVPPTATERVGRPARAVRTTMVTEPAACSTPRTLLCADLQPPFGDGPTMRAQLCPSAASVTVEYTAPPGTTRAKARQTVAVGSCSD
jgi:hypothetical protein